jgi:hypothetical protein
MNSRRFDDLKLLFRKKQVEKASMPQRYATRNLAVIKTFFFS